MVIICHWKNLVRCLLAILIARSGGCVGYSRRIIGPVTSFLEEPCIASRACLPRDFIFGWCAGPERIRGPVGKNVSKKRKARKERREKKNPPWATARRMVKERINEREDTRAANNGSARAHGLVLEGRRRAARAEGRRQAGTGSRDWWVGRRGDPGVECARPPASEVRGSASIRGDGDARHNWNPE